MDGPLTPTQLAAIQATLRSDNKIEAVKLYREFTRVGLAEAKTAVERIEAGKPSPGVEMAKGMESMLPERVRWIHEALFRGDKIEAIKLYREGTNCQLKEAKEAMDMLETELRKVAAERFTARASVLGKLWKALRGG